MGLLDVIGPVMIGPSSSHTAGACRISLLARALLEHKPRRAQIELHGSFAKTGKGHGSQQALVAGLLGFLPDDDRIPNSFDYANKEGLSFEFINKDLGNVHPNSVRIVLHNDSERACLLGSSLGGGAIRIVKVNDFDANFSGGYYSLLVEHDDRPGVIAKVARVLADNFVNIATLYSARNKRGGKALMSLEIDKPLEDYALNYLKHSAYVSWLRLLPKVMSEAVANYGNENPRNDT